MATALTDAVIGCVIRVHQVLGAGFVEKIYRRALVIELRKHGIFVEVEKQIPIYYDGRKIGNHVLDIVVERQIILEIKIGDALSRAHYAQVRSYLKATRLEVAFLINFSGPRADFRRVLPYTSGSIAPPTPQKGDSGDSGDTGDGQDRNLKLET